MKHIYLFFIMCILLTGFTACGSTPPPTGTTNTTNTTNTPVAVVNEQKQELETPSHSAKIFLEAVRQREYSVVRELLSQRSLSNLEQMVTRTDTNLDQTLKRIVDRDAKEMLANNVTDFEFRNEKITNNQASLEVKATNAPQYARISLSKENNQWKINIDETTPSQ